MVPAAHGIGRHPGNAHVDDYLARTTTIYRIIVGGLVLYPEDISPGGPLTVLYPEPLNISRQDHIPCIGVGLVLYSEPSEVWHVCQGWVHHPMPIKRCRWWTDIWRTPGRWSGLRLYPDDKSLIFLARWLNIIFLSKLA